MYCEIDCQTLNCKRCNKKIFDCNVTRNCIIDEPQKIIKRDNDQEQIGIKTGTEIKKLLSRIGIKADSGCKCSDRSRHIDYMESIEPGWAEKNIEQIVDWMQEEAKKRKLPFVRAGAKFLVKLAIRRAKK